MFESAKLFFRGPVWVAAGVLGGTSTVVGIVGDAFWMWLSFGLAALVLAAFYSYHRHRVKGERKEQALPGKLDALIRDGSKVVAELSEPVQPTETEPGVWAMGLVAEEERWDQAFELDERARELLLEGAPALLADYAEAATASLKRDREKKHAEHEKDQQDQQLGEAERFRRFVDRIHQQPESYARAFIEGTAAARKRLGY
jgi:hypothetical protein